MMLRRRLWRPLCRLSSFLQRRFLAAEASRRRTILVMGSSGATGSAVAQVLGPNNYVLGADVVPRDQSLLDGFIALTPQTSLAQLTVELTQGLQTHLRDQKLDALMVASGGWAGDPEPQSNLSEGAVDYARTIQHMMDVNWTPVVASAYIAQHFMRPHAMMCVVGATLALSPTPGMLGYGLSKAGAHHLVTTLGSMTSNSVESKSLRRQGRQARAKLSGSLGSLTVVGLLPTTLDTPANRQSMPQANFENWVQPLDIAHQVRQWIEQPALRPHSGALLKVTPRKEEKGLRLELVR